MKIVQSFWSKPERLKSFNTRPSFGWKDPKYNYFSWALSCLQFREFYPEVELVTDRFGKELLADKLQLPYTYVNVCLDDLPEFNHTPWILGKIYAYSIQDKPFIHADGDVFIWERFSDEIESASLLAQQIEIDYGGQYLGALIEMLAKCNYLPECFRTAIHRPVPLKAINAGIIGGKDLSFIRDYANEVFKIIEANNDCELLYSSSSINMVLEQLLFFCMADERALEIVFNLHNIDYRFSSITDLHDVKGTKYIHFLGANKLDILKCEQLANRLLEHYPDVYYRICRLLENNEI